MNIIKTELEGVVIIEPRVFEDERGYFFESFSQKEFEEKVCRTVFVQDNESRSSYGVLRGLHYQLSPHAQSKLIRVTKGMILDVAVDIRRGSPTFGCYAAVELSASNRKQMFVPRGFAHGFIALENDTVVQYKCDNYYAPQSEGSIAWNDPAIGVKWGIAQENIILSDKDADHPSLSEAVVFDYNDVLYRVPSPE